MKQLPPPPELRILLTNLVSTLNLSPQTHYNTINILMHPNLPELANQDIDICVAALFISQKLHQTHPYSIVQLCARTGVNQHTVLSMELLILQALRFRLVAGGLLIDDCLAVAYQWDRFVTRITCIDVRFFHPSPDLYHNGQFHTKICNLSTFSYRVLLESVQKLAYKFETARYNKLNLSLAIVSLCIKQAERYQSKTKTSINIGSNCSMINRKMNKMGKIEYKSTDFIIGDFMRDVYGVAYEDIRQEIAYAKGVATGLRDITTTLRNIKNITERTSLETSSRRA